jgi:hypothetical protein
MLSKLRFGQSAFSRTVDRFFLDLAETISILNFPDVNPTGIWDQYVLIWDAATEKFVAVHRDTVSWFPPTTTTEPPPTTTTTV